MEAPRLILYNEDGSVRWDVKIVKVGEDGLFYKVQEDSGLFNSDSWEAGETVGIAIDHFMAVETELINGL